MPESCRISFALWNTMKGILGKKLGMTQVFDENGQSVPVTILQAGPCFVSQVKTVDKDRYDAVQLAFGPAREKVLSKAEVGHLKKSGLEPMRELAEFRGWNGGEVQAGQEIRADIFEVGEKVKVTGVSKGKGFQGGIKRHGFKSGRATHGSHFHRAPGSLGATSTPGRVFKGRKLPGHAGSRISSAVNLTVVKIDTENNLLLIKGALPGPRTAVVRVEGMK